MPIGSFSQNELKTVRKSTALSEDAELRVPADQGRDRAPQWERLTIRGNQIRFLFLTSGSHPRVPSISRSINARASASVRRCSPMRCSTTLIEALEWQRGHRFGSEIFFVSSI